ncbi:MAG: hypothetical protein U1E38_04280 [Rhodospirillales bacterium]
MNARLAGIEAGMQTLASGIDGLKIAISGEIGGIKSDIASIRTDLSSVKDDVAKARDAASGLKAYIIGTGIALAALLAAMLAYGVQNFDTALSALIQTIVSVKPH